MKNLTNYIVVAVVAGLLVFAGSFIRSTGDTVVNVPKNDDGTPKYGALPGPDIPFPYISVGNVEQRYASISFNTASTTICSVKSPVSTSTLVFGSVQVTTASTTALLFEIGKSTVIDATTTSLGTHALGASAKMTMLASTTPNTAGIDKSWVFSPSTYFNVKYGKGIGTVVNNGLAGTCKVKWIVN